MCFWASHVHIHIAIVFHKQPSPIFLVTKVVYRYRVTLFGVGNVHWPPAKKHIHVNNNNNNNNRVASVIRYVFYCSDERRSVPDSHNIVIDITDALADRQLRRRRRRTVGLVQASKQLMHSIVLQDRTFRVIITIFTKIVANGQPLVPRRGFGFLFWSRKCIAIETISVRQISLSRCVRSVCLNSNNKKP